MSKRGSRGYVFTINNPTEQSYIDCLYVYEFGFCRYIIIADEVGDQGTPHIQGYVYFHEAKSRKMVSQLIPHAWLEVAKATGPKAFRRADYCRKDGSYSEFGKEPKPGVVGKEYLEYIMANPYENIHLYNQYNKMHRALVNSEVKTHQRKMFYCYSTDKFKVAKSFKSCLIDDDTSVYNNQECVMQSSGNYKLWENWLNGFPDTIKRGYELITLDPTNVVLVCVHEKEVEFCESKNLTKI